MWWRWPKMPMTLNAATTGNFCGSLFLFSEPNKEPQWRPQLCSRCLFFPFSHFPSAVAAATAVRDLTRTHTHLCIRTKLQFPLRLMKNVSRATPSISHRYAMAHLAPIFPSFPPAKSCHQLNFKRLFLHVRKSLQKYLPRQPCVVSNSRFLDAGFAYHSQIPTIRFDYAFKSNCCRRGRISSKMRIWNAYGFS